MPFSRFILQKVYFINMIIYFENKVNRKYSIPAKNILEISQCEKPENRACYSSRSGYKNQFLSVVEPVETTISLFYIAPFDRLSH